MGSSSNDMQDQSPDKFEDTPHRRFNILTGEWVLVSAHRSKRPWNGQMEAKDTEQLNMHDAGCYLCPGNTRVSGIQNPEYQSAYIFENDHAALLKTDTPFSLSVDGLLQAESESGCCKVICFTPRHDLTLAEMDVSEIKKVVDLWTREYAELAKRDDINYVQIFENKGAAMGCSNPHPHGQIWAQESIPSEPKTELQRMKSYFEKNDGKPMLIDYATLELQQQKRVVCQNDHFVVVVPYWAGWPFEVLVLPKQQCASLLDFSDEQANAYADILKQITVKYDNLFNTSFPYSAGIHQAPVDGGSYPECTFHMHFYPPLLRSAQIKKFMVGYEMLAESQRDITPEKAAAVLRSTDNRHYKRRLSN